MNEGRMLTELEEYFFWKLEGIESDALRLGKDIHWVESTALDDTLSDWDEHLANLYAQEPWLGDAIDARMLPDCVSAQFIIEDNVAKHLTELFWSRWYPSDKLKKTA